MRVLDLGPLCIESAGVARPVGGRRLEALLCALLVRPGQVVGSDYLVDAVWGGGAPPRAAAALDTLMWRLRRLLEPERTVRAPSTVLRSGQQGYALVLADEQVDSWAFSRAADRLGSLDLPLDTRLDQAAAALARWRGRPYEAVEEADWLEPVRARLDDQRLTVQRIRIDALLAAGQPERAVSELTPMLAEQPYAEPLWTRRLLGLQQSGRPAAARAAYRECVELFRRELGTDPGSELRALSERLTGEPVPGPTTTMIPTSAAIPFRVPRRRNPLVGRSAEQSAVVDLLDRRRQVTVVGPVGCGKTRLAIAVAETMRERFSDGTYFVDLCDVRDPALVADRVQEALQIPDDQGRGAEHLVADFLHRRTALLVLDNCEQVAVAAAGFAEAVLAAGPAVTVLATSRHPLGIDRETVFTLDPLAVPAASDVESLRHSPAARLFAQRLDDRIPLAERSASDRAGIAAICAATDGLPLSLELAAALSPVLQLTEISAHLAEHPTALQRRDRDQPRSRGESTLHDSIDWSHGLLTTGEQLAHRRLAVLPTEFTLEAALAVCADEQLGVDLVLPAIAGLTYRSLLQAAGPDRPDGPSRFRQLMTIRSHAGGRLDQADERREAADRRDAWTRDVLMTGPRLGRPGQARRYRQIEDNYRVLTTSLEGALAAGPTDDDVWAMARLAPYWIDRTISPDPTRLTAALVETPDGPSPLGRLVAVVLRGAVLALEGLHRPGRDELVAAVSALADVGVVEGDRARGLLVGDLLILFACCSWGGDDYELAAAGARAGAAYAVAFDDSDLRLTAAVVDNLGSLWSDPERAAARADELAQANTQIGNDLVALLASVTRSIAALLAGDGPAGLHWTGEGLRLQQRLGVRQIADTLETRGNHYVAAGLPIEAARCYAAAQLHQTRVGRTWPRHPGTAERLAGVRAALDEQDFDRAWAAGIRLGADDLVDGWL